MHTALRAPGRFHLALRLAFFAIFAQIALGMVSSGHQARMLGAGPGTWSEVCTPLGIEWVRSDDSAPSVPRDAPRLDGGTQCAICAVAALAAPPHAFATGSGLGERTAGGIVPPRAAHAPARPRALRPPSQAPPVVS